MRYIQRVGWAALRGGVLAAVALLASVGAHPAAGSSDKPVRIYVSPNGKDVWPGTFRRPFATVTRAQRRVRELTRSMTADIVVNLRGGTHELAEPLVLADNFGDSGQNGHRVIYQASGYGTPAQEPVVLSGGRRITGWKLGEGSAATRGIWQTDVGNLDFRQLYVNGRRAIRSALGTGLPGIPGKGQAHLVADDNGYQLESPEPQRWARPEDIEFVYTGAAPWAEARCGVASITGDATTSTVTMDQPCWKYLRANFTLVFFGYYPVIDPTSIENSESFVRRRGSFYLDKSSPGQHVLSYIPRAGEDIRTARVIAPVLETLVSGSGTSESPIHDISFRGIAFSYATWLGPDEPLGFAQFFANWYANSDNVNPTATDWATNERLLTVPGHVVFHESKSIVLEGNRFTHLGGVAVEFSHDASDNVVRGNVFSDISGGGVEIGTLPPAVSSTTERNIIENNWIHDIGVEYDGMVGILTQGGVATTVAHNQVNDTPYSAIVTVNPPGAGCPANCAVNPEPVSGHRVRDNLVFDAMKTLGDGGGIYFAGAMGTSWDNAAAVTGNLIHGVNTTDATMVGAQALYLDDGTDWITAQGNVIYRNDNALGGNPSHAKIVENFWDDDEPVWAFGSQPAETEMADNTVLPADNPEKACMALPACEAIRAKAGLEEGYRHLLGLDDTITAPDTRAPVVSGVRARFTRGKHLSGFVYGLTEAAQVSVTLVARRRGRAVSLGRFTKNGAKGSNSVVVPAKLRRKARKVGRYLARLQAQDSAGNRSRLVRLRFRVGSRSRQSTATVR